MKNYDFDWQINKFMIYCRSTQLRERTMYSYEQTLRLFERWCADELKIYSVVHNFETNFKRYILRAGLNEEYCPHCLRNNFAKRCLMNGMDIYTLSKIPGHSSVEVTEQPF